MTHNRGQLAHLQLQVDLLQEKRLGGFIGRFVGFGGWGNCRVTREAAAGLRLGGAFGFFGSAKRRTPEKGGILERDATLGSIGSRGDFDLLSEQKLLNAPKRD